MKYSLIKLPDEFIITSDELPSVGDKCISPRYNDVFIFGSKENNYIDECTKVISQQNDIDFSQLPQNICELIGYYNIEEISEKYVVDNLKRSSQSVGVLIGYMEGLKHGINLTSNKKYDVDDISSLFEQLIKFIPESTLRQWDSKSFKLHFQSILNKPKSFNIDGYLSENKFIIINVLQ